MILLWRKWSWKTALARFLEENAQDYDLNYVKRFKINDLWWNIKNKVESMLFHIYVIAIKNLLEKGLFEWEGERLFGDWLNQLWWVTSSYSSFIESALEKSESWSAEWSLKLNLPVFSSIWAEFSSEIEASNKVEYKKMSISSSTSHLQELILKYLKPQKVLIFLDDITDYLDGIEPKSISLEINNIKDLLHKLDHFNSQLRDSWKPLRFIACLRDDVFSGMVWSNVNKLKNNLIDITRNENWFYWLIQRRITLFHDKELDFVQKAFPTSGYDDLIDKQNIKEYQTKFYQFVNAISFNRPRDFLKLLWSMKWRIPDTWEFTIEMIRTSLMVYTDYFFNELFDELTLLNLSLMEKNISTRDLKAMFLNLASKDWFKESELRNIINKSLNDCWASKSLSKKNSWRYIEKLWEYWILWYKSKDKEYITYFYTLRSNKWVWLPNEKDTLFYLHRGLNWYTKKYSN